MIAAAFAVVGAVAVAGWARKPAPATAYNAGAVPVWDTNAGAAQATAPATAPAPGPDTQTAYDDQQPVPGGETPAASACAQPVSYGDSTPTYANRYSVRTVRPRVIVEQPRVYQERRVVRRGRSTGTSVAIVAGSAGVGAAIGALAGGGKGAGIGALAGGGGGFVYDRLTHNR